MIRLIDRVIDENVLERAVQRCRERGIILPTFAQQKDPGRVPDQVKSRLEGIGLWDLNPLNLFRITWKNEPKERGGLFGKVNCMELPKEITGIDARIVTLIGKWFPTGARPANFNPR